MNLGEILAGGQERRKKLDQTLGETLNYYLGPTGIPQRLAALGVLNPVNDMEQASQKAKTVFSPDATGRERLDAGVGMVTDMATVLAPVAAANRAGSDATAAVVDSLLGIGQPTRQGLQDAGQRFAADEAGAVPLRGGGMSDPTQTGWTFRDVDASLNRLASGSDNRRMAADTSRIETVPIRSLYAMQPSVNPDFATTLSSAGELPLVVRKDGKMFVRDGHHRLTKVAEEGGQSARVRFIDLDNKDTSAPLLDYDNQQAAKAQQDAETLLAELFGENFNAKTLRDYLQQ